MNKSLAIIIVVYDNHHCLLNLLDSIEQQTFKEFDVFIIDNNSSDTTKQYLKNLNKNYKVFFLSHNTGYATANNFGIKEALKYGFKYYLIVNPDIILEPNAIEEIFK